MVFCLQMPTELRSLQFETRVFSYICLGNFGVDVAHVMRLGGWETPDMG